MAERKKTTNLGEGNRECRQDCLDNIAHRLRQEILIAVKLEQ